MWPSWARTSAARGGRRQPHGPCARHTHARTHRPRQPADGAPACSAEPRLWTCPASRWPRPRALSWAAQPRRGLRPVTDRPPTARSAPSAPPRPRCLSPADTVSPQRPVAPRAPPAPGPLWPLSQLLLQHRRHSPHARRLTVCAHHPPRGEALARLPHPPPPLPACAPVSPGLGPCRDPPSSGLPSPHHLHLAGSPQGGPGDTAPLGLPQLPAITHGWPRASPLRDPRLPSAAAPRRPAACPVTPRWSSLEGSFPTARDLRGGPSPPPSCP